MAKGRIVNTTPTGKHSLRQTRFTVLHSGGTYNRGRNDERREVRRRERLMRLAEVNVRLSSVFLLAMHGPVPKRRMSHLTTEMLSNRRLRQLDARRYG